MKEIGKVFMTHDYNMFSYDEKNRNVDPYNVARIVDSMKKNFLITISLVIRTKDKLIILDGQHRLESCKILKKPYYFTIVDDLDAVKIYTSSDTLATLQNTKKWMPHDYVKFYARQGKGEYEKMEKFMEETGLPSIASHICLTGTTGVAINKGFFFGRLQIKDLERGYALAKIINKFKEMGLTGATNPRFVSALFKGLMRHSVNLKKLYAGVESRIAYRWIGNSVTATLANLEAYSHSDRGLHKRHIEHKNQEWPYSI